MKAIIIHTFEDDGTERIQKLWKEQISEKLVQMLDEEATRERKTLILFREDDNKNMTAKVCGKPINLILCTAKLIQSMREKTGAPEDVLLGLVKEILDKMEKR